MNSMFKTVKYLHLKCSIIIIIIIIDNWSMI